MQKDHCHICPYVNHLFGQVTIIRRFAFYTTTLMRELASDKAAALTQAVYFGVLRYIEVGMNLNIKWNKESKQLWLDQAKNLVSTQDLGPNLLRPMRNMPSCLFLDSITIFLTRQPFVEMVHFERVLKILTLIGSRLAPLGMLRKWHHFILPLCLRLTFSASDGRASRELCSVSTPHKGMLDSSFHNQGKGNYMGALIADLGRCRSLVGGLSQHRLVCFETWAVLWVARHYSFFGCENFHRLAVAR